MDCYGRHEWIEDENETTCSQCGAVERESEDV
jgi:hypothetical protein